MRAMQKIVHIINRVSRKRLFFGGLALVLFLLSIAIFFVYVSEERPKGPEPTTAESEINRGREIRAQAWQYITVDPEKARMIALEGLASIEHDATISERLFIYGAVGSTYTYQAQYHRALEFFYRQLESALHDNDQIQVAIAYQNIGLVNSYIRNYKDAVDFYVKSIDMFRELQDSINEGITTNNLGRVYYNIDDLERAWEHFSRAYDIFFQLDYVLGMPAAANHKALYFQKKNVPDSALYYFRQAIDISEETGNNYGLSIVHNMKGKFFLEFDSLEKALYHFQESDSISSIYNYLSEDCFPKLGKAKVYFRMGDREKSLQYAHQAFALADNLDNDDLRHQAHETLSYIYERLGMTAQAFEHYRASSEIQKQLHEITGIYQVYNIEVEQLSRQMEINQIELEKQKLLLGKRKDLLILTVVISVSLIIIISLLYYFYVNRIRQAEKEKLHRQQIQYTKVKNLAVLDAENNERKRLASELHDGIGTQLSLTKLTLSNILDREKLPEDKKEKLLRSTVQNIDEIIREVKSISNSMTPLALSDKGFKEAIKELVAKFSQIRSYSFKLNISGLNGSLKPYAEQALYRTVQEMITNTIKHAQGSELNIQILQDHTELTIMIEDNGKGFDINDPKIQKGFGLKNAISRIENLNGQLLVDSSIGRGTIVTIIVPVHDN